MAAGFRRDAPIMMRYAVLQQTWDEMAEEPALAERETTLASCIPAQYSARRQGYQFDLREEDV